MVLHLAREAEQALDEVLAIAVNGFQTKNIDNKIGLQYGEDRPDGAYVWHLRTRGCDAAWKGWISPALDLTVRDGNTDAYIG